MRFRFALVAAVIMGLEGRATAGEPAGAPPRSRPYRLKWPHDAGITALGAGISMTAFIGHSKADCYPGCVPPEGMLAIDRSVIGNYSPAAHSLAGVIVGGLVLAPMIFDAADSASGGWDRWQGWVEDSVVLLQSVLLAQAVTQLTKSAVGRTAPFVYNPLAARDDLDSPDAFRSFVSGHSSTAFAAATAYATTFWKRHPTSSWRFVVLGVGQAIAATVGLLKIEAGYHYPTDIAAGALVGIGMGILVPTIHSEW